MNSAHRLALQEMATHDGIEGCNVKMQIGAGTCYLKYAMRDDQLVWVDITLAEIGDEGTAVIQVEDDRTQDDLIKKKLYNNKAMLEIMCRSVSALLQCGEWSAYDLIDAWQMTHFEPEGLCPQVEGFVKSPCDAAARYFRRKGFVE
jgi:hypothetical protein